MNDDLVILVDGDLEQQVRVTDHFLVSGSLDRLCSGLKRRVTIDNSSDMSAQLSALPRVAGVAGVPTHRSD